MRAVGQHVDSKSNVLSPRSSALAIPWKRVALYASLSLGFFLLGFAPMWFKSYGPIGKILASLVNPRTVTVNDKLPLGSPSGSFTTMYEPVSPFIPVIGPTFSTGKLTPFACTDNVDAAGTGGEISPRLDVNRVMRV